MQQQPAGLAGAISGISNNILVIAGGNNFPDSMPWLGGKKKYYSQIYVFSKQHDTLVMQPKIWQLPEPIGYAATGISTRGIVYAGGENENGISKKAGLLQWDAQATNVTVQLLPDLPLPLTNAAAAVYHDQVYVAGGETGMGVSDHLFMLDLTDTRAGWKQLPSVPKALSHSLAVVQINGGHDNLYLLGGRKKNSNGVSDLYATVFAFDLITRQWRQKKSLPYALSAGTGVASDHHHILVLGGDTGKTFHQTEILLAAIAGENDPVRKQAFASQKNNLQYTHPGFSREILEYNTITGTCSAAGTLPFETPVTTHAFLWNNEIVIPTGETRAGVRTGSILMGELKNRQ